METIMKPSVFYAVALAMGVAGIVLTVLQQSSEAVMILYGVGLFCLAINGINKK